ncbi:MAG: RNA-binding protein [Nitrososphaerota archaeon]
MSRPQAPARKLVLPGDVVSARQRRAGQYLLLEGGRLIATRLGFLERRGDTYVVLPIKGPYIPRVGDRVVGKVIDVSPFGWELDINAPRPAFLPLREAWHDRRQEFSLNLGDLVYAKVMAHDRTRDPQLTLRGRGMGKIKEGELLRVNPMSMPRLIGRRGSLMDLIRKATGTDIKAGQNGLIVISGPPDGVLRAMRILKALELDIYSTDLVGRTKEMLGVEG